MWLLAYHHCQLGFRYLDLYNKKQLNLLSKPVKIVFFAGYVFGGDVLRLFHGHMDECLALPEAGSENEFKCVKLVTHLLDLSLAFVVIIAKSNLNKEAKVMFNLNLAGSKRHCSFPGVSKFLCLADVDVIISCK